MKNILAIVLILLTNNLWAQSVEGNDFSLKCESEAHNFRFSFNRIYRWVYGNHRTENPHLLKFDSVKVFGIHIGQDVRFSNSKGSTFLSFYYSEPNYDGGRAPHGTTTNSVIFEYEHKIPDEVNDQKIVGVVRVNGNDSFDVICTLTKEGE
jgi:hypothetical protein